MQIAFDNSYARLPETFHARLAPTPVALPRLLHLNAALAHRLGLDPHRLAQPDGLEYLAGNRLLQGAEPLAMAYAGHQFGQFVPSLGDGRAILLGEILLPEGERLDLQLKGSGRTPFSRGGDGRAWIAPVLREYLISEAMHALAIPTTRALAAVATGEAIWREQAQPGAILVRVARGHVRIGTFEYFAARRNHAALRTLADYVIARHDPEARHAERPYRALLDAVIERQATLVARWLGVGFIHGVMNTDNMAISGDTIDYGPCAFMDQYDPDTVYSSIDYHGRYAYANQPGIAQWNLARFAETLLPLLDADPERALTEAQEAIDGFQTHVTQARLEVFRTKLGLLTPEPDDETLINEFLDQLHTTGSDFTNSFRALYTLAGHPDTTHPALQPTAAFAPWLARWHARLQRDPLAPDSRATRMRHANPAIIPRNHEVAAALEAALAGDLGPFESLHQALSSPWDERPLNALYTQPPTPDQVIQQTFCGT